ITVSTVFPGPAVLRILYFRGSFDGKGLSLKFEHFETILQDSRCRNSKFPINSGGGTQNRILLLQKS
ncbi:MAG: hypothetical protein LKF50_08325, partial [Solobacterium sp.]|nr:hypothetical protein [Solobacterium sp.]